MSLFTSNVLRALMGGAIVVLLGLYLGLARDSSIPDVGTLDPIVARPAEEMEVHRLGSGETFGQILSTAAIDTKEQSSLLLAFREQANPRRMRPGTEIVFRRRPDDDWLRGVDVALNSDETIQLTRDQWGWHSSTIRTPVWTDTLYVSGVIEDILWNAVVHHEGLSEIPMHDRALLLDHLDKVFQWQIDFTRQIQRGDYFRFVFERAVRPDGSMRTGHLVAAELVNSGRSYQAFWFDPNSDGQGTYYDSQGRSVRRAFLKKPLEFRRISGRFSNRFHPILKRWRSHKGIDYAANAGTPIQATADGVVTQRGPNGGLGNSVTLRHPNGYVTRYGHMSRFARISVGSRVKQGEVIGYVGQTGLATGPHLHYELIRSGRAVDPMTIELPAGDPVPRDRWEDWTEALLERQSLLAQLPDERGVVLASVMRIADQDNDSEGGQ